MGEFWAGRGRESWEGMLHMERPLGLVAGSLKDYHNQTGQYAPVEVGIAEYAASLGFHPWHRQASTLWYTTCTHNPVTTDRTMLAENGLRAPAGGLCNVFLLPQGRQQLRQLAAAPQQQCWQHRHSTHQLGPHKGG